MCSSNGVHVVGIQLILSPFLDEYLPSSFIHVD